MSFFEPDVIALDVTYQPVVVEVTIIVTQVESGYRVRRKKRYESFERIYDVLGELLKPFTGSFIIRVIIRNPVEFPFYVSSNVRRLITLNISVQSDIRKDVAVELLVDADLRKDIEASLELQGQVRRAIELSIPASATINLTQSERDMLLVQLMAMIMIDGVEKNE